MHGGKHIEQGSFQEVLDRGNFFVPVGAEQEEEPASVRKYLMMTVIGVALAVVMPTVLNPLSVFGLFGAVVLLTALIKLWPVNGWFKAGLFLTAAVLVVCAVKEVRYILIEDLYPTFSAMAAADPVQGALGLALLTVLMLGIRRHEGQGSFWMVLAPITFAGVFALGYVPGGDWVIALKAILGVVTVLCYYKMYKSI